MSDVSTCSYTHLCLKLLYSQSGLVNLQVLLYRSKPFYFSTSTPYIQLNHGDAALTTQQQFAQSFRSSRPQNAARPRAQTTLWGRDKCRDEYYHGNTGSKRCAHASLLSVLVGADRSVSVCVSEERSNA